MNADELAEAWDKIIKGAVEKAISENNLAWGRRIGEKDNHIRALEEELAAVWKLQNSAQRCFNACMNGEIGPGKKVK